MMEPGAWVTSFYRIINWSLAFCGVKSYCVGVESLY